MACSAIFCLSSWRTSPSRWPGTWQPPGQAGQPRHHDQGRGVAALLPRQPADVGVGHEPGLGPDAVGVEPVHDPRAERHRRARSRRTSSARRRPPGAAAGRTAPRAAGSPSPRQSPGSSRRTAAWAPAQTAMRRRPAPRPAPQVPRRPQVGDEEAHPEHEQHLGQQLDDRHGSILRSRRLGPSIRRRRCRSVPGATAVGSKQRRHRAS